MPRTALVWFRRDLRVHDHPALTAARREADRVVPVFVLDPRLLDAGRFPSANRAWFLLESLRELRAALRDRGGELFVREGRPEEVLPALAAETGAGLLHFAADVSPFATARDRRVEAALTGVQVRRHAGVFVADVSAPRTAGGRPFSVFSPFWRRWERLPRREVHGAPRALRVPSGLTAGTIPRADPEARDPLPPGRDRRAGTAAAVARRAGRRVRRRPRPPRGRYIGALALPALRLRLRARGRGARPLARREGGDGVRPPARVAGLLRARPPRA